MNIGRNGITKTTIKINILDNLFHYNNFFQQDMIPMVKCSKIFYNFSAIINHIVLLNPESFITTLIVLISFVPTG